MLPRSILPSVIRMNICRHGRYQTHMPLLVGRCSNRHCSGKEPQAILGRQYPPFRKRYDGTKHDEDGAVLYLYRQVNEIGARIEN